MQINTDHVQALVAIAAFIGPLVGTIFMLQIKTSVQNIRFEVVTVVGELRGQILRMETERHNTEFWISDMRKDIDRLQSQQEKLTRSVLRCQAFHNDQEERNDPNG